MPGSCAKPLVPPLLPATGCHPWRASRLGAFLPEYMEPKPGRFVSVEDGRDLGPHDNVALLTVGQGAKVCV